MRLLAPALIATALLVAGCDPLPKHISTIIPSQKPAVAKHTLAALHPTAKRVTKRKANLNGKILILEYHKLSGKNTQLDRTPAKFRADLEKLYKQGYRPVTLNEWLDDKMPLPPGASPVIITFDDGHDSQFRFKKDGSIDPNCFVGIWREFAEKHADFPVHGTFFFVLPKYPFGQIKHVKDKIKMLQSWGSEIDCHTYHHKNLARCDDETVKKEIATALDWLEAEFGVTNVSLAFPYGNKPRHMNIVKGFEWNGKEYSLRSTLLAAGEPADPITSKKYNPWLIHRVVVCEDEGGSTTWLNLMQKNKKYAPYVAP
jgi:peptidoglycan/xylan/chitin deacetylase (PgdA/CDA1 family)